MPDVSAQTEKIAPKYDSRFLRAFREFVAYRPHLNACLGSASYVRKKTGGERPMTYEDVVAALKTARREGAKKGLGPEMLAVMLNTIIQDTLDAGEQLDVEARPAESHDVPIGSRQDEELQVAVSAALLIAKTEEVTADGHVDVGELRDLHGHVRKVSSYSRRLVLAVDRDSKRGHA